ncbi:heavy-metal-associated domain-containing protein [Glutamicibacter sp. M10]|uniref:heavy-metal-associated domain-containing protein n=1 Tax=Micrococcaceae TaxID=1268 RepID=UPI001036DC0D|nr:heavy-metal-associated domain-containing protein [Glutamicibacter sp. M10]TAP28444.1 copper chaperone [Arthrobacter sp. S41]
MSHECNCGCSNENNSKTSQGLQITTRDQATPLNIQTELKISGMTCGHCVASVTEELKELSGVQNVDVVLDAKGISTATVTATQQLSEASLREAIDEAGYTLEAINA